MLRLAERWHLEAAEQGLSGGKLTSTADPSKKGCNLVTHALHVDISPLTMWIPAGHGNKCLNHSTKPETF